MHLLIYNYKVFEETDLVLNGSREDIPGTCQSLYPLWLAVFVLTGCGVCNQIGSCGHQYMDLVLIWSCVQC